MAAEMPPGTQVIGRAAALLRAIPRGATEGRKLQDLAEATQLTQPTCHRILKALAHEGLVHQDRRSKLYRLGPFTYELGLVRNPISDMIDAARPWVEQLARTTGDSCFLALRSGSEIVCMIRQDGSYPIRASTVAVGERVPLGLGSLGISVLSELRDDEIDQILQSVEGQLSEYRIDIAAVAEKAKRCRTDGYITIAHPPLPEIRSYAAPVKTPPGLPGFGLATVAIDTRYKSEHIKLTISSLRKCAEGISQALASFF